MIFFCVRHGESTHNVEGRLQGQSDVPSLSDLGRRQSAAAAEILAAQRIEVIYASPLRRARETAEIIADRLGLPIKSDPRLMEIDVGLFQDRLRSDVDRLYPAELAAWLSGDPNFRLPEGESRTDLAKRGCAAFREIARAGHDRVVVVSHGGLILSTFKTLLGIPLGDPPPALQNASISTIAWDGERFSLVALDRIDHLRGIGLGGKGDLAV
jgi:probable phosphoglycerate mutase